MSTIEFTDLSIRKSKLLNHTNAPPYFQDGHFVITDKSADIFVSVPNREVIRWTSTSCRGWFNSGAHGMSMVSVFEDNADALHFRMKF